MSCAVSSEAFGRYFKENMDALGLPTPTGYYESLLATFGIISTLSEAANRYPTMAVSQVKELKRYQQVGLLTTLTVSFYAGALIGSAAVALGRTLGCGTSLADAIHLAKSNGIYGMWVERELVAHPEFLNPRR